MATNKTSNILIPLIRKTMPSLIADQLISIQPMTGPTSQIYVMKNRFSTTRIKFIVNDSNSRFGLDLNVGITEFNEMVLYCSETFGDRVTVDETKFWFKTEADRDLFLLRWAE